MRTTACFLLVLAPLLALSSCNSGIAALAGSSDTGDSPAVPSSVSNLAVTDSKNSPAEIRFTLAG